MLNRMLFVLLLATPWCSIAEEPPAQDQLTLSR